MLAREFRHLYVLYSTVTVHLYAGYLGGVVDDGEGVQTITVLYII